MVTQMDRKRGWSPLIALVAIALVVMFGLYSWAYYAHVTVFTLETTDPNGPRAVHVMYVDLPEFCDGHAIAVDRFFYPMLVIDKRIRPKIWDER